MCILYRLESEEKKREGMKVWTVWGGGGGVRESAYNVIRKKKKKRWEEG